PLTASMPSAPASRARLGEGDGVQHPRGNFRFLMGLKCRDEYEKIKRNALIGGSCLRHYNLSATKGVL
ncbi:hypothetical protein, partial [Atlantibacter hermannii]|uniref:hypothetical protein n=1 Tax=Atlantibacter hermannii TaxID=565 RepID=UPI0028A0EC4B